MIKKHIHKIIFVFALVIIIFLTFNAITNPYYRIIYENRFIEPTKVYDINPGFSLEQTIHIHQGTEKDISLFIYMAPSHLGYANNDIAFMLSQGEVAEMVFDVKYKYFGDNRYTQIDFDSSSFHKGTALLTIKGLHEYQGSAGTIWLTGDISQGYAVVNGEEINESLRFKYATRSDNPFLSIKGGGLVFLVWLLTYILIIIVFFKYYVD